MNNRLTVHLYRVDEACCMFRYALIHALRSEALFWADELFSSGCLGELNIILFEVWLFFVGVADVKWLLIWYGSDHDYNDVLCNVYRLCLTTHEYAHLELFREILSGKTPDLKNVKDCAVRTKVFRILTRLFVPGLSFMNAVGALWRMSIRSGCIVRKYEEVVAEDVAFDSALLPIKRERLYGLCERGQIDEDETTIWELRGGPLEILLEKGTDYWSDLLIDYDKSDEYIENFVDTHFPYSMGDIPDEWPLEKQELTHGKGCLPVGTVATVSECLKSLGVSADICEILKTRKIREGVRSLFEIV